MHLFPALNPSYAGDLGTGVNPKVVARVKSADLVLLVGGRLGEMPSQGYTLLDIPNPQMKLVHVYPDPDELGRVYRPDLAINAAPTAFAAALEGLQPPNEIRWRAWTKEAHEDYLAWTEQPTKQPGNVNFGEIMVWLRGQLSPDTHLHQRRGQFLHLDAPLLPLQQVRHAARADFRLDGLRAAGGGRRRSGSIRSARSSAWPATAIS